MKKIASLLLAVLLVFGLAVPALAAEDTITVPVDELVDSAIDPALLDTSLSQEDATMLIAPNPMAGGYACTLVVNGETVDTSAVPAGEGIPMDVLAQADYFTCEYYAEEELFVAYFGGSFGTMVEVTLDGAITAGGEPVEGYTASVVGSSAFLPVEFVNTIQGYTASQEGDTITVTTPNNTDTAKIAHKIIDAAGLYSHNMMDLSMITENYDVSPDSFVEGGYFGSMMMTAPDCLLFAKLAEGADVEAVVAAFNAYRQQQYDTFSWYLSHNLYKVEDSKVIVKGDYVMLLIAPDHAAGLAMFNTLLPTDTYTVKKGDTMGFIAVNFYGSNGYHRALTKANAAAFKATKGKLVPGMVLTLPEKLGSASRMEPAVADSGETLYTVKLGDTLGKIAKAAYGKSSLYKSIFERNSDRLKSVNTIYEGQVIVLPDVKTVTINVVDNNGKTTAFTYTTTAKTIAEVLVESKLVENDDEGFGLEINTVNGLTADWENDSAWWKLTKGGEELEAGSGSAIADGDVYELTYTIGF